MTTSISYSTTPTGSEAPKSPTEEINKTADGSNPNGGTPQNPQGGERPAWLPENFKTPEDFAKNWTDQRAELTRVQQELAKVKKGEEPPKKDGEGDKAPTDEEARKAIEESGVDNAPYQSEFDTSGDLSPESRAKAAKEYGPLIKKMFGENADPEAIVNSWVDGQKNLRSNYQSEVKKAAGGDDNYEAMVAWAATNYDQKAIAAYDAAVNSGDINAARQAVESLVARYTKANGSVPNLLDGDGPSGSGVQGFASAYEMQKAIADPRYEKDVAYRKSVEQRIGKSNF